MKKITFTVLSIVIALPLLLWLGGQGFGYGPGFGKPAVPQGSKVKGPTATGMIAYIVNPPGGSVQPWATVEFQGQCTVGDGSKAVTYQIAIGPLDVTQITDYASFAAGSAQSIADAVDNFFTDKVTPPQTCWPGAFGVYVQSVYGAGMKTASPPPPATPTVYNWTGNVGLKGVFH